MRYSQWCVSFSCAVVDVGAWVVHCQLSNAHARLVAGVGLCAVPAAKRGVQSDGWWRVCAAEATGPVVWTVAVKGTFVLSSRLALRGFGLLCTGRHCICRGFYCTADHCF